jgi:lysyl-tRNA synthetase class I
MTRKLEEEFNLVSLREAMNEANEIIDNDDSTPEDLERALVNATSVNQAIAPLIDLSDTDKKLDDYATQAMDAFKELMTTVTIDPEFADQVLTGASQLMKNAITAQTARATTRLRAVEVELKRLKFEADMRKESPPQEKEVDISFIDRNELHRRLSQK